MIVRANGDLFCTRCRVHGYEDNLCIMIYHEPFCPTIKEYNEFGPYTIGQAMRLRGEPFYATSRGAECDFHLLASVKRAEMDSWADWLKTRNLEYEVGTVYEVMDRPYNYEIAVEALAKSNGIVDDAKQWYKIWASPAFERPEHEEFVGVCMALSPLELTPYVINWILSWLTPFALKNELLKLRLIESVQASCRRMRDKKIEKQE